MSFNYKGDKNNSVQFAESDGYGIYEGSSNMFGEDPKAASNNSMNNYDLESIVEAQSLLKEQYDDLLARENELFERIESQAKELRLMKHFHTAPSAENDFYRFKITNQHIDSQDSRIQFQSSQIAAHNERLLAQEKELRLLKSGSVKDNRTEERLRLIENRLSSIDINAKKTDRKSIPFMSNIEDSNSKKLPGDTYSLMMISAPFTLPWNVGVVVWMFQLCMYILLVNDQLLKQIVYKVSIEPTNIFFNLPAVVSPFTSVAQIFALLVTSFMQDDVFIAARTLSYLNSDKVWHKFDTTILSEIDDRSHSWWTSIGLPNALKSISGSLGLALTVVVILQNVEIINLFKDFTALAFIGELDELVFNLATINQCGRKVKESAKKVEDIDLSSLMEYGTGGNPKSSFIRRLSSEASGGKGYPLYRKAQIFSLLTMMSAWVITVVQQRRGIFIRKKYPNCDFAEDTFDEWFKLGNGECNKFYNVPSCRFDGGDCEDFNREYPDCDANLPIKVGNGACDDEYNDKSCRFDGFDCFSKYFEGKCKVEAISGFNVDLLGDGVCHGRVYNTEDCKYDAGDCLEFNRNFPKCDVDNPYLVGNGICDHENIVTELQLTNIHFILSIIKNQSRYLSAACGFDGGDCIGYLFPDCELETYAELGNGICNRKSPYNTIECGYDGGDCVQINKMFPECSALSSFDVFTDRDCDRNDLDKPECNYDGGECLSLVEFPSCNATSPPLMSRGYCNTNCGVSSGCRNFHEVYPFCNATDFSLIGNGVCDDSQYNIVECGYEDYDCVEVTKECQVVNYKLVGNGVCNGGLNSPYLTKECGYDGGDCIEQHAKGIFCSVEEPELLGDGKCHGGVYNTPECGFDNGDCLEHNDKYPACKVSKPFLLASGSCYNDKEYNSIECGYDGGDCDLFNLKYPNCTALSGSWIGDGLCDGGVYNSPQCGFDGGDCLDFNIKFPACNVTDAWKIGDRVCHGGIWNTEECGWDDGACLKFNQNFPHCRFDDINPEKVGDGECDMGNYNTPECGYDGGDCL